MRLLHIIYWSAKKWQYIMEIIKCHIFWERVIFSTFDYNGSFKIKIRKMFTNYSHHHILWRRPVPSNISKLSLLLSCVIFVNMLITNSPFSSNIFKSWSSWSRSTWRILEKVQYIFISVHFIFDLFKSWLALKKNQY